MGVGTNLDKIDVDFYARVPTDKLFMGLLHVVVGHQSGENDVIEEYYNEWGSSDSGDGTNFAGGLLVTNAGHGLSTGDKIMVYDNAENTYNGVKTVIRLSSEWFQIGTPYESDQTILYYKEEATSPPAEAMWASPFDGNKPDDPSRLGYGQSIGDHDLFIFAVGGAVHLGQHVNDGTAKTATYLANYNYSDTTGGVWYTAVGHPKCQSWVRSRLISRFNNSYGHAALKHSYSTIPQQYWRGSVDGTQVSGGAVSAEDQALLINNGRYEDPDNHFEIDLSTPSNNDWSSPVADIQIFAKHVLDVSTNSDTTEVLPDLYKMAQHPTTFWNLNVRIQFYSFDDGGSKAYYKSISNVFFQPFGETADFEFSSTEFTS